MIIVKIVQASDVGPIVSGALQYPLWAQSLVHPARPQARAHPLGTLSLKSKGRKRSNFVFSTATTASDRVRSLSNVSRASRSFRMGSRVDGLGSQGRKY